MIPTGISGLASTQLAVTNRRILGKVRKHRLSVPFAEVETAVVGRGIMGLLFGYGTITISGNGMRVRFPGIIGVSDIKNIIDSGVDEALFGHAAAKETLPPPDKKPAPKPAVKTVPKPAPKAAEKPVEKPSEKAEEAPRPSRPPPDPNVW